MDDKLIVKIGADTSALSSQLQGALSHIVSWGSSVQARLGAALSVGSAAAYFTALTKNAIDAADRMNDLAQAVGVPIDALTRFDLAAKTSGVSTEALGRGLKNLGVAMMEAAADPASKAAAAFRQLGVNVTEASGKLRPTQDVLLDVAEAFSKTENSAQKTAIASEIFGQKFGYQLIPFLNNGKEGLEELARTAEAFGLVLDQKTGSAADRVADNLTVLQHLSSGLGNRIMREVLPTLEGLTSRFLNAAKDGTTLQAVAEGVAAAFKLLVSAGAVVTGVFESVGKVLGGVAAAVMQAMQGDFKGAWATIKESAVDVAAVVDNRTRFIKDVWTDSLGAVDDKTRKFARALEDVGTKTTSATKKVDEYGKAVQTVQALTAKSLGVSADYVTKLQALELWYGKNRDKTEQYVKAVEALIWEQESSKRILKEQEEAQKAANKAADEAMELEEKRRVQIENTIRRGREIVEGLEAEAAALQMTSAEREIAMRLRELEKAGIEQTSRAYEIFAERIRAAVASKDAIETNIKAQKDIEAGWRRTSEQIEQALTDALVQGFTKGKPVIKSIGEWIKNYFLTNVARSIAQSTTGVLTAGLSSIASAAGIDVKGAGMSGVLSGMSSSIFGSGGAVGGLLAGAGWLTGSSSLGGVLGAAGSLIGTGSLGGIASGLMMGAGALGPIALAAWGLSKLFGKDRSPAQQAFTAIGSTDFGYRAGAPNLVSSDAYRSVLQPIVDAVADIAAKLGGKAGGTSYGIYTSASPDKLGATLQVNAASAAGTELFRAWSNAANDTLQQRIADTLPSLLLAGLQDAKIGDEFKAFFADLKIGEATAEQINAAIEAALAKKAELDKQSAPKVDDEDVAQAHLDTAYNTGVTLKVLNDQLAVLQEIANGIVELAKVSASGFADLANRPVQVTVQAPEVNGGRV